MLPGMRPFVLKSSWAKFDQFIAKNIQRENLFRPAATPDIQTVTDIGAGFPSAPPFQPRHDSISEEQAVPQDALPERQISGVPSHEFVAAPIVDPFTKERAAPSQFMSMAQRENVLALFNQLNKDSEDSTVDMNELVAALSMPDMVQAIAGVQHGITCLAHAACCWVLCREPRLR